MQGAVAEAPADEVGEPPGLGKDVVGGDGGDAEEEADDGLQADFALEEDDRREVEGDGEAGDDNFAE